MAGNIRIGPPSSSTASTASMFRPSTSAWTSSIPAGTGPWPATASRSSAGDVISTKGQPLLKDLKRRLVTSPSTAALENLASFSSIRSAELLAE